MIATLCLLLQLLVAVAVASKAPVLPWTQSFSTNFVAGTTTGTLIYSWPTGQRINHGPGGYECVHFYNAPEGCDLVFTASSMYAFFRNGTCCHDTFALIGAPRPDWTSNLTLVDANTTDCGALPSRARAPWCRHWHFETSPHHYWDVPVTLSDGDADAAATVVSLPLGFAFPNPNQTQWYDPGTFQAGPQDPSLFVVPDKCSAACGSLRQGRRDRV